ncbi:MAG: CarD family transcriptional regulator [Chloroflexi bacterium]|jgi:RNA polymerase-interacting CarD/CdnL/TRCF family regulator|nr:CarD family transcriptional regulator [Chloroflexota bacterium]
MFEQKTAYQVGDQVIHRTYGLGEIIQLDEKVLSGHIGQYYVVQIYDLTLWVPINDTGVGCLRNLTPAREFQKLFRILASPGEPLSPDRYERKTQLTERLKDGTLESICRVVRDLTLHKQIRKMNDNDSSNLDHAKALLLNEWSAALSVPFQQAEHELRQLLDRSMVYAKQS